MILQTGNRTDIPAFYSEWFANRLREGYVLVRNPFNPVSVTRYEINPAVVDLIVFCTKNPTPMLQHIDLLKPFCQYWFAPWERVPLKKGDDQERQKAQFSDGPGSTEGTGKDRNDQKP